jgi:hypothetical protein
MANKIILGKRPKSFKRTVSFPMPGEAAGTIEVSYKYRTRSEFAAFSDEFQSVAKAEGEKAVARITDAIEKKEPVAEPTQAEITERQNALNVRYLMGALDGWNLDEEFNEENVAQLVDELPAAANAIAADYRSAINEGRLGN